MPIGILQHEDRQLVCGDDGMLDLEWATTSELLQEHEFEYKEWMGDIIIPLVLEPAHKFHVRYNDATDKDTLPESIKLQIIG